MSNYYAQAVSREDMRQLAYLIRKKFGYLDIWSIPVELLLDKMCVEFEDFSYEIIPDDEWDNPSAHADTDVLSGTIRIRESVYLRACNGLGRDRMTIAHEIAHFILICLTDVKLYRSSGKPVPSYQDPEWQAKCLAGELMVPYHKLIKLKNPTAAIIEIFCGVSSDAANYQLKYLRR
ncbi:MAG: ImmA/IrrE family metallo-endopeptidase [Saccharofermentans sp.]|nr:ImmA/IrrE family metallo-endopeptidase [Clostridia bacterium]MCQ2528658.1 ImmA/IrrE family metallo-endopeptidase [Saccharofermentans sp.]